MALNTNKDLKQYYTISEVAKMFNINETALRFWEKEFPTLIKPRKGGRGIRMYTQNDIDKIGMIYHLVKERGMTLEGARKELTVNRGVEAVNRQMEIIEHLKIVRDELQAIGKELNDLN